MPRFVRNTWPADSGRQDCLASADTWPARKPWLSGPSTKACYNFRGRRPPFGTLIPYETAYRSSTRRFGLGTEYSPRAISQTADLYRRWRGFQSVGDAAFQTRSEERRERRE